MVTFNFTEEFLRQAKRLAKRYHSLADDIDALILESPLEVENAKSDLVFRVKAEENGAALELLRSILLLKHLIHVLTCLPSMIRKRYPMFRISILIKSSRTFNIVLKNTDTAGQTLCVPDNSDTRKKRLHSLV